MLRRSAALVGMLLLACLTSPAVALAGTVPDTALTVNALEAITNEKWQHATYFVTDQSQHWYGASVKMNTGGLWIDGFDDQHEVSLTVYADKRYGETGGGYNQFPTFAVAFMRNDRLRKSVNLWPNPSKIDVITLSTCAVADDENGQYHYANVDGRPVTVNPGEDHVLTVRYSGQYRYVYNRDGVAPEYHDGVPWYCDWVDLKDADGLGKGHYAYKWVASIDGVEIDSAWLTSATGRVKIETNKRHLTYAPQGSRTDMKELKLGNAPAQNAWRAWDAGVATQLHVTRGDYVSRTVNRYTWMYAHVPGEADRPSADFVKYTNPVAYDLKSLQATRFYMSADRDDVWAELYVKTPYGTKTIFKGTVPDGDKNFYFPLWDGKGPKGEKLPSAIYDWQLKLTKNRASRFYGGKISVSRIYVHVNGLGKGGSTSHFRPYLVAGNANCYISADTNESWDRLSAGLAGPGSFWANLGRYDYSYATGLAKTVYLRSGGAPKAPGLHDLAVTGSVNTSYNLTIIQ